MLPRAVVIEGELVEAGSLDPDFALGGWSGRGSIPMDQHSSMPNLNVL